MEIRKLLTANKQLYSQWLSSNGFTPEEFEHKEIYSISNLYIPKIYVQGDRLQIRVPKVQFWLSIYLEKDTIPFLNSTLLNQSIVIGDRISQVKFTINEISIVTPVVYKNVMEYQTLSPIVIKGVRPNRSVEYLFPQSPFFSQFMVEELIQKWEFFNNRPYTGDRHFSFHLLSPERRKAVTVFADQPDKTKVIGYMIKFRLVIDPQLQEIAYVCGLGDDISLGFGYVELVDKSKD